MSYISRGQDIVIGEAIAGGEYSPTIIKLSNGGFVLQYGSADDAANKYEIRYQIFDSGGVPVTESRVANHGNYSSIHFVAQANGGYAIVQFARSGGSETLSFDSFDAAGTLISSKTNVTERRNVIQTDFRVTPLEGGGWVVSEYVSTYDGGRQNATLFMQSYDAAGEAVGAKVTIGPIGSGYFTHQVTALHDGGFAFTFGASFGYELRFAANWIYSAEGERLATTPALVELPKEAGEGVLNFIMEARPDGGMIFVRRVAGDIVVEQINGTGQRDHAATVIETDLPDGRYTGEVSDLKVTVLEDGGFVVTWFGLRFSGSHVGSNGLYAQSFDSDGAAVGGVTVIDPDGPAYLGDFDIVALPDGGFAMAWGDRVGPDDVDVIAQMFDSTAQATSSRFTMHATTFNQDGPELAVLDDGTLAIFWTDGGNSGNAVVRGEFLIDASNRIEGTAGADAMAGGIGDHIYVVNRTGDHVSELAGEGIDMIEASVSYTLPENVENLLLLGNAELRGTGNSLANILIGNSGNNSLDGKSGADRMAGAQGDDIYVVDDAADIVVENIQQGYDTVRSFVSFSLKEMHVEKLVLSGSASLNGFGNNLVNELIGNGGANILDGSGGMDMLRGGAGADIFKFSTRPTAVNIDTILDFNVAADTIGLAFNIYKAGPKGVLAAGAFQNGTVAVDAGDRILYDVATGHIWYDSDGTGAAAAVHFATVTAGLGLTNADFLIL